MVEINRKEIKVKLQLKFKNGKELTLGEEEAKELYDKLDDLFGKKTEFYPYYPVIYRDYTWVCNPGYVTASPNTAIPVWEVIGGGTSVTYPNTVTNITYSCNLGFSG